MYLDRKKFQSILIHFRLLGFLTTLENPDLLQS